MLKTGYNRIKFLSISIYLFIILLLTSDVFCLDKNGKVSRIELSLDSNFTINLLDYYGLDTESAIIRGDKCILLADEYDLKLLSDISAEYKILCNDVSSEFQEKYNEWFNSKHNRDLLLQNDFEFGSMGGYYTLEEIYAQFDSMKIKFPEYFTGSDTIGYTFENRPIIVYTFGDSTENSQQVFINSLHHAREPGGAMVVIFFLKDLLNRAADNDNEALYLLRNRTLFVIPVVNPDGYYFNQLNNPSGGGMWRKNRVLNADSSYGVDLNRNYGPYEFWNAPVDGSSEKPSGTTYRGTEPFSEKETQAIRDFVLSKKIILALNYHTYGNLLLYPYSALQKNTPDSLFFAELAEEFSHGNRYVYGRDEETVRYTGRGVADDWLYWTDNKKPVKTLSLTPEIGTVADNFWAMPDRIIKQCYDNLYMNYQLLWSADVNWRLRKVDFAKLNGSIALKCELINTGVNRNVGKPQLKINSLNTSYQVNPFPVRDSLNSNRYYAYFPCRITSGAVNGDSVKFEISIEHNNLVRLDTFMVYLHTRDTIQLFADETLFLEWNKGNWDGEYDKMRGRFVLSDSPLGYYPNNDSNYLTLLTPIDLRYNAAYMTFDSFWDIETNYDYGIVEISDDGGKTWRKSDTRKMAYASGARGATIKPDETGFTGLSHRWFENFIPLNQYLNKSILIRFGLLSDRATNRPGWLIDNIRIFTFSDLPVNVADINVQKMKIYPNPAERNQTVKIYSPETKKVEYVIVSDLKGNIIAKLPGREYKEIQLQLATAGGYLIEVRYKDGSADYSKLLIR